MQFDSLHPKLGQDVVETADWYVDALQHLTGRGSKVTTERRSGLKYRAIRSLSQPTGPSKVLKAP